MLMTPIFIALSLTSSLKFQIHVSNCSQGPRDEALLSLPLPPNVFLLRLLLNLSKLHPYLPRCSSQISPWPSLSMCNSSVSPVLIVFVFLHQHHHASPIHLSPQPRNELRYRPLRTFVIWIFTTLLLPCPQGPEIVVYLNFYNLFSTQAPLFTMLQHTHLPSVLPSQTLLHIRDFVLILVP